MTTATGETAPERAAVAGEVTTAGRRTGRLAALWTRLEHVAPPLMAVALFALALTALHRELATVHLRQVLDAARALPRPRLAGALLLTLASYGVLTLYDRLGLAYLGRRLPWGRVAMASFVSCALSNSVGHTLIVGAPARYRLYGASGLSALDVARLSLFVVVTFWAGFCGLAGVAFTLLPPALPPALHLPGATARPLGFVLLALLGAYLALVALRRRPFAIGGWELELPAPRLAVAQLAVAVTDWIVAGSVLWLLLPAAFTPAPGRFLAIYLLAQLAGIASQVPGGLGVFETVFLLLAGSGEPAALLGSLVVFRFLYYLLPLAVALALLVARELGQRRAGLQRAGRALARLLPALAPPALAVGAFAAGAVLLLSGATPALPERLRLLHGLVPLPVVEASHFLGSLAGAGLLLLARGLERRLDAAWLLASLLLAVGIGASLLKGFDYEEALLLAALLGALLPARRSFYRRSALLAQPFTAGWNAAIALVLIGTTWLGLFAHKHVAWAHELWWRFALHGDAPRFLRATVGVLALLVLVAAARLLRPAAAAPAAPGAADLERAAAVVARSRATGAHLALLGDKRLLWHPGGAAFLMYGVENRCWIAMGDPVGAAAEQRELAWEFRDLVDRHDGWTVFYQARPESLHLYLDLGLSLLKLGEAARVPLPGFSLAGPERKWLRHVDRKLAREGVRFEVVAAAAVPAHLDAMREISDRWLATRATREKGFSLGRFAPDYLRRCPAALVWQGERLVAFANLWLGADREELSLDLMRHLPAAPAGVMDYLFLQLALWGRDQGYGWLDLGMAPLSGLEERRLAPLWSRAGALAFRHGEHFYNFQGLRQFKEKFEPLWEPRYLASPGGLALPRVLASLATLIGGGARGALAR